MRLRMCASVCVCFAEFLSVMYIHIHKHSHCAIHLRCRVANKQFFSIAHTATFLQKPWLSFALRLHRHDCVHFHHRVSEWVGG